MSQSRFYWAIVVVVGIIPTDALILWYFGFTPYEIAVYLFAALLGLVLFVFVFFPSTDQSEAVEKTRLVYLYERKDVIYENLRDLNFEHKAGKFTEADFDSMRDNMEAEAARVLAEIDKLEKAAAT